MSYLQERLADAEKNFKGKAEMMQQIIIKVRAVQGGNRGMECSTALSALHSK